MVINIGKADARRFVIASVILLALGIPAIICGVVEAARGEVPGVVVLVFGVGLVLAGLYPAFNRRRAFRPRRLIIEQGGIRWDDPHGEPWAVAWQELAAVALCRNEPASGHDGAGAVIAGLLLKPLLGERAQIALDLLPGDDGFYHRRPEMARLWTGDRLRLRLGHNARLLPQMDAAIRQFAPYRYHGILPG